jgi:hypothetical protein
LIFLRHIPETRARDEHFCVMQEKVYDPALTYDTALSGSLNDAPLREPFDFSCKSWSCAAPPTPRNGRSVGSHDLHVTDIVVCPNNRYSFEVLAGNGSIISFHFDDLSLAATAACDMRRLARQLPPRYAIARNGDITVYEH